MSYYSEGYVIYYNHMLYIGNIPSNCVYTSNIDI